MAISENSLRFSFAAMQQEVENMASLAKDFIEPLSYAHIIPRWLQQLRNFSISDYGATTFWSIPLAQPITTILSTGEYVRDDEGEHTVFGTLSAVWEIATEDPHGNMHKKGTPHDNFFLVGLASTRIRIFKHIPDGEPVELARWRFEVGDSTSPGCHFHASVLGEDDDVVFPKAMDVPRLPGLLVTPMDSLEFLLGEIFQTRWKQHTSRQTDYLRNWAGHQRKRLLNLLAWQRDRIAELSGSPWTSFKGEKPLGDMLIASPKR